MSDLISRKVVMDWLRDLQAQTIIQRHKGNSSLVDTTIEVAVNNFINFIVQVPTAYDVDKVVEQLESIRKDENIRFADQVVNTAICIVKCEVVE